MSRGLLNGAHSTRLRQEKPAALSALALGRGLPAHLANEAERARSFVPLPAPWSALLLLLPPSPLALGLLAHPLLRWDRLVRSAGGMGCLSVRRLRVSCRLCDLVLDLPP